MKIIGKRPTSASSKFKQEVVDGLLSAIACGMPALHACRIAGVHQTSFNRWLRDDPKFAQRVELARALFAQAHVNAIQAAASKDWRASAWLLEHLQPENFAKSRLEISGTVQHGHTFSVDKQTLEAISAARQRHEAKKLIEITSAA